MDMISQFKWQNSYKEAGQYRFKAHVKAPNNIYNEFLRFFWEYWRLGVEHNFFFERQKRPKQTEP